MIKELTIENAQQEEIINAGIMFREFYEELHGKKATSDLSKYIRKVETYIDNPYFRFFLVYDKGFCIIAEFIDDLKEPVERIYEGIHIYIRPEYRKTRLYKQIYDYVAEETKDGTLYIPVLVNSNHLPVIEKRHKLILKVFEFIRR